MKEETVSLSGAVDGVYNSYLFKRVLVIYLIIPAKKKLQLLF